MIILNLPYPPSVNAYWLQSGKRRYISKRGVEFKNDVLEICKDVQGYGDMPVEVSIDLHPRDKRLIDVDNCCKAILDSLQGAAIFNDDCQVWKLTVERKEKVKGGGCKVSIRAYNMNVLP